MRNLNPGFNNAFRRVEKALLLDQTFWGWPLLIICVNLILGLALGAVRLTPNQIAQLQPSGNFALSIFLFGGSADGARYALNFVGGASVSIVTLTFSLTVLSIQMAAFNYTPRILDEFLRDYRTKISLGVYLGTFVYCFIVGWQVQSGTVDDARVPIVAVNFLLVHVVVVLSTFVHFIQYFVNEMRLESVLRRAAIGAIHAAESLEVFEENDDSTDDDDQLESHDENGRSESHNTDQEKSIHEHDNCKKDSGDSHAVEQKQKSEDQDAGKRSTQSSPGEVDEQRSNIFHGFNSFFSKLRSPGCEETEEEMSRFVHGHHTNKDSSAHPRSRENSDRLLNFGRAATEIDSLPPVEPRAYRVLASKSGYVTGWTPHRIKRTVTKAGVVIRYRVIVGEFVTKGTQLAWAWPVDGDFAAMRERIDNLEAENLHFSVRQRNKQSSAGDTFTIQMAPEVPHPGSSSPSSYSPGNCLRSRGVKSLFAKYARSCKPSAKSRPQHPGMYTEQHEPDVEKVDLHQYFHNLANQGLSIGDIRKSESDVTLGIRQLSDIALRALSPGVNDPQTAVQVLDYLSTVFARLAHAKLPDVIVTDEETEQVHLAAPGRDFDYLLSTCMNPIRNYGKGDINVVRRAMYMLADIGSICVRIRQFGRVRTVLRQLKHWRDVVQNEMPKDSMDYKMLSTVYERAVDEMEFAQYARVPRGRQRSEEKERVDDGSGEKED